MSISRSRGGTGVDTTYEAGGELQSLARRSRRRALLSLAGALMVLVSLGYSLFRVAELQARVNDLQGRVKELQQEIGRKQEEIRVLDTRRTELSGKVSLLERQVQEWRQKSILDLVFLNYSQRGQEPHLQRLRLELRERWYAATNPQLVDSTLARPSRVVYYFEQDSTAAARVEGIAEELFAPGGCSFQTWFRPEYARRNLVRRGQMEVYVAPGCDVQGRRGPGS